MLTDSKIRAAKNLEKSYKLTDSSGLYLMASPHDSKLWYFRYTFGGNENRIAFGPYPLVSLAETRAGLCHCFNFIGDVLVSLADNVTNELVSARSWVYRHQFTDPRSHGYTKTHPLARSQITP